MNSLERLKASKAITGDSFDTLKFLSIIDSYDIVFNIIFNHKDFTYYPYITLKSSEISNKDENYVSYIKKFNNFDDAYILGIDIVIFLILTIYVREINEIEHTNKHINYLSEELPIPIIISKLLYYNNENYFDIIKSKVIKNVDWDELIKSFTRQIISDWDD